MTSHSSELGMEVGVKYFHLKYSLMLSCLYYYYYQVLFKNLITTVLYFKVIIMTMLYFRTIKFHLTEKVMVVAKSIIVEITKLTIDFRMIDFVVLTTVY